MYMYLYTYIDDAHGPLCKPGESSGDIKSFSQNIKVTGLFIHLPWITLKLVSFYLHTQDTQRQTPHSLLCVPTTCDRRLFYLGVLYHYA